jgi:hypothetical protein
VAEERILNYTYIKIMIDFIDECFIVLFLILGRTFHSKLNNLFLTDVVAEKLG